MLECRCSWKLRTWAKAEQEGMSRCCVSAVPGADLGLSPPQDSPLPLRKKVLWTCFFYCLDWVSLILVFVFFFLKEILAYVCFTC